MPDPMAYPDQDPAELRAQVVRDAFERIETAVGRLSAAQERYTSAAIRGIQQERAIARDDQQRAAFALGRLLREVEAVVLNAMEEAGVRVVHDTEASSHA